MNSWPFLAAFLGKLAVYFLACADSSALRISPVLVMCLLGIAVFFCSYAIELRFLRSGSSLMIFGGWLTLLLWCALWQALNSRSGSIGRFMFIAEACLSQFAALYGIDDDPRVHF
jgi:hypothetical protein